MSDSTKSEQAYEDIRAERARQVAKGRDAAHDDKRAPGDWHDCLGRVLAKKHDERTTWVKVGSVAVAAIQSIDRWGGGDDACATCGEKLDGGRPCLDPDCPPYAGDPPPAVDGLGRVVEHLTVGPWEGADPPAPEDAAAAALRDEWLSVKWTPEARRNMPPWSLTVASEKRAWRALVAKMRRGPHDRADCPCGHESDEQGPCGGCNCADEPPECGFIHADLTCTLDKDHVGHHCPECTGVMCERHDV